MTDSEIAIKLHDIARTVESMGTANLNAKQMREIADRFVELTKK
jgi:hypothetical protein